MKHRFAIALVIGLAGGAPSLVRAQESQFGIPGLGTPGRSESVRARSTGGAFAPFDPSSLVTEASLVDIGGLTASASLSTSNRDVVVPSSTTWLRTTRFPLFSVGGAVSRKWFFGGAFSSYLDRTYSIVTRDSMILRGTMEPYVDQITSDGGVTDVHLAGAYRLSRSFALGLGVHLLPGSTRESATRTFDNFTTYSQVHQIAQVRYEGYGIEGSALLKLGRMAIAAYGRKDSHLNQYLGDTLTFTTSLPVTFGGGIRWTPLPNVKFAGSAKWSSWADALSTASNTLEWSAGTEIGLSAPIRFGVRGGQHPFGPGGTTPSEWSASLGAGRGFAHGHGFFDAGIERLIRNGTGLEEQVWSGFFGITVRP